MQKRLLITPAVVAIFILGFTVFGERGLLRINHLHRDRDEIQKKVQDLKSENDKLKREISALQSDKRYLESIARRDFGLVRTNEVIYQFSSADKGAAPAAAQPAAAQEKAAPVHEKSAAVTGKGDKKAERNTEKKGEQPPPPAHKR